MVKVKAVHLVNGPKHVSLKLLEPRGTNLDEYKEIMLARQELIVEACLASRRGKARQNIILHFKWNDAGLQARVQTAAAAGMTTAANHPVTSAEELKLAIVHFMCSGPEAGVNMGGHNDMLLFTEYHSCVKAQALIMNHLFLGRHVCGHPGIPPEASTWPDLVEYFHWSFITRINIVTGPVNSASYFN